MRWTSTLRLFHTLVLMLLGWWLTQPLASQAQTLPASEGLVADSTELRVLRQFYGATQGAQWTNQTNWLQGTTSADFATWYGVQVAHGDVVGLELYANHLLGPLPASLGELRQLVWLNLPVNQLSGPLPASLGQLGRLTDLQLWQNQLSDSLPASLGQLAALQTVSLAQNHFAGPLPASLGQLRQLVSLDVYANQLTGRLPAELGQLSQLRVLSGNANHFSGPLPPALGQLSQLRVLDLGVNQLTGPLPAELGKLSQLQDLQLWQNNFHDSIPAAWGGLQQLQSLNLAQSGLLGHLPADWSQFTALRAINLYLNQLSGPLPASLVQLPQLVSLQAEYNALSGPLPASWSPALVALGLGFNRFSGSLPAGLAQAQGLQTLRLGANQLTGFIPPSYGQFAALTQFWLGHNQLTGPLPPELGRLHQVGYFDVEANALSGTLPDSLGQLQQLTYLGLKGNALRGSLAPLTGMRGLNLVSAENNRFDEPLPAGLGQLTNLVSLALSGNRLPGPLPADLGQAPRLGQLLLAGNQLTGTIPANLLTSASLRELALQQNQFTDVEDLGGATGQPAVGSLTNNELSFTAIERLYQGPGQARLSYVDARSQRPPSQVETTPYEAGGPLVLSPQAAPAPHGYAYQWQRQVGGLWVDMPGDTLLTKSWTHATAAEQGSYRRAGHDRWFTDGLAAPTVLYSATVYADLLPYVPLAQNRPDDANRVTPKLAARLPEATPPASSAPAPDLNYVRSWSPRVALTDSTRVPRAPVDSVAMSTQYLDGLGRPVQTVLKQASPARHDLVQPQAYDGLGREPRQYLPYPSDTTAQAAGSYRAAALAEQYKFYARTALPGGGMGPLPATDLTRGVARTGAAYAETLFEASPLNRVVAQGAAGEAWQLTGGHKVERVERPNTAQDSVLWFQPGYDPASLDPGYQGFYAPGELWGTDVSDVHGPTEKGARGYRTLEWKDKLGQVVLRQVEAARTGTKDSTHSRWLRTAYVYDDFGHLRFVLQPEASKRVLALGGKAPAALPASALPFLFHYRYDGRGRQIAKQVPGQQGETVVVYDQLDRPVLSQDPNQARRHVWSVTKYDVLGRIILSGELHGADTLSQRGLQAVATADTATTHQYEGRTSANEGYSYDHAFPRPGQDGFGYGQVLTLTYYDDYDFNNDGQADVAYDPSQDGQFPSGTAPVADALRTTGMVTRTKTRVLGVAEGDATQAAWLTTTTFYDERARPVQVQTTNARKGTDLLTTRLDFTGKVVQSVATHQGPSHAPVQVAEFFRYDHTGRVLSTRQQLPGEARAALVDSVQYNEIGQAVRKTLGTGRLQQDVDYAYNIRGWLTSLNDPYFPVKEDLFNLSLHYEQGFTTGYEQYNGNLTGQTWRGRDGVQRAYGYVYDPLNRLLQGDFVARQTTTAATPSAGAWTAEQDNYRLSFVSYDDNGNILTLRRRGLLQNATHAQGKQYGAVDNLSYAYQGNRLLAVDDAVTGNQLPRPKNYNGAPTSLAGDFQEQGIQLGEEYLYDANGNLTQDKNKGITGIVYNHLNLPRQIHFGIGADSIVFRYTAAGQKVAKLVYQTGKPTLRTDYLGPYQYEQDSLRFFPHAEGRVLRFANTTSGAVRYQREFTFKDHLGNLRLAYRAGQVRTLNATLEPDAVIHARESQQFDSLSVSSPVAQNVSNVGGRNLARTGNYVALLNAAPHAVPATPGAQVGPTPLGPLTQFAVQQGDTVRATAFGLYPQATSSNSFAFSLVGFIASLLQPAPTAPAGVDGARRGGLPLLQVGLSSATLLALHQLPGGVPKGYLRVLSFNEDSVLVDQRTVQLSAAALGNYDTLQTGPLVVQQNGYVSVYVGNESAADVYFDDVSIEHRQGLQVQENQYDPFGLDLAGVSGAAPGLRLKNFYQFNGKENQLDLGLNWNHQDWRFFDYQIGRWHVVDPEIENAQESWGPYSFGFDNAVRYADANGRNPGDPPTGGVTVAGMLYNTVAGLGVSLVNASVMVTPGMDMVTTLTMGGTVRASVGADGVSYGIRPTATTVGGVVADAVSDGLDLASAAATIYSGGALSTAGRALPMGAGLLLEQGSAKVAQNAVVQKGKALAKTASEAKAGPFSISDWAGYPAGNVPKPQGPFRIVKGEEYKAARNAANQVNGAMHKANPSLHGKQLHEVHPVKFGGSPIDPANKVPLSPREHSQYTNYWNNILRELKK